MMKPSRRWGCGCLLLAFFVIGIYGNLTSTQASGSAAAFATNTRAQPTSRFTQTPIPTFENVLAAMGDVLEVISVTRSGQNLDVVVVVEPDTVNQATAEEILLLAQEFEDVEYFRAILDDGTVSASFTWIATEDEWFETEVLEVATPLPTQVATRRPTAAPILNQPFTPQQVIYSSAQFGMQPVIGPIDIPTGVYRVTASTSGFIIVDVETVAGECVSNGFGTLFNLMNGQASPGAQTILVSQNCQAIIQVSNTSDAWTLSFDLVNMTTPIPLSSQYNSGQSGLYAAIGPVIFPDGRFRVTASTSGFLIADIVTVTGTCDSGFGTMFNLMQGQAVGGAQAILRTEGCWAFIITTNANEPWTLSFEPI